jgi:hypothetical protein
MVRTGCVGGGQGLALLRTRIVSLTTAASIPGFVLMHRANHFAAYMFAARILFCPRVFYPVHVELRYRDPILWIMRCL